MPTSRLEQTVCRAVRVAQATQLICQPSSTRWRLQALSVSAQTHMHGNDNLMKRPFRLIPEAWEAAGVRAGRAPEGPALLSAKPETHCLLSPDASSAIE
ncbi:unnamed protein product [Protopolystoma xenopodis]|uniref:Uncharacterized protein n=1 Tax=Protopolystoma xenopodis TaxID=117903 RepID=A0A3S5BWV5_9PLAT|nr:unnamed protein product [Protopolystoma xenopodis]